MQLRERLFVPFLLLLHFGVLVYGQQLPGVLPGVVQNLANNPLPTIASPQPLNTTSATIQQGALAQAAGLIAGVQPASPSQGPTSYQQPVAYPQQSPQQGYAQQGYAQPSYPQAPQTYAQPPPSYVQPPQGYVQPPQGYAQPPPPSYVQPPQASYVQPQGYAQPQASYVQPSSYAQPQSYAQPPASYPQPHNTYVQPQSYAQAPNSYAQPQTGYAQPQSGYAQSPSYVQPAASYAQPQGCSQGGGCGGSRGASLPDLWSVPFETNSNGYLVFQENGRKKGGCQCCDGEVEVPVKNSACESQCRAHGKRPCEETDDASGEEDNDCGLLLLVRQPCKNCGGGRAVPSFLCPNEQRPTVPCPRSRCGLSYRSRRALPAV